MGGKRARDGLRAWLLTGTSGACVARRAAMQWREGKCDGSEQSGVRKAGDARIKP